MKIHFTSYIYASNKSFNRLSIALQPIIHTRHVDRWIEGALWIRLSVSSDGSLASADYTERIGGVRVDTEWRLTTLVGRIGHQLAAGL